MTNMIVSSLIVVGSSFLLMVLLRFVFVAPCFGSRRGCRRWRFQPFSNMGIVDRDIFPGASSGSHTSSLGRDLPMSTSVWTPSQERLLARTLDSESFSSHDHVRSAKDIGSSDEICMSSGSEYAYLGFRRSPEY